MRNAKLKKCSCGGKAEVIVDTEPYFSTLAYYVRCDKCRRSTGMYGDESDVIEQWNKSNEICEICTKRHLKEGTQEWVEVPAFGKRARFAITEHNVLKCVIVNPDWVEQGIEEVEEYEIKYCPNCGRDLNENKILD